MIPFHWEFCLEHQTVTTEMFAFQLLFKEMCCEYLWSHGLWGHCWEREHFWSPSWLSSLSGLCFYFPLIMDPSISCVQTHLLFHIWLSAFFLQCPAPVACWAPSFLRVLSHVLSLALIFLINHSPLCRCHHFVGTGFLLHWVFRLLDGGNLCSYCIHIPENA